MHWTHAFKYLLQEVTPQKPVSKRKRMKTLQNFQMGSISDMHEFNFFPYCFFVILIYHILQYYFFPVYNVYKDQPLQIICCNHFHPETTEVKPSLDF